MNWRPALAQRTIVPGVELSFNTGTNKEKLFLMASVTTFLANSQAG